MAEQFVDNQEQKAKDLAIASLASNYRTYCMGQAKECWKYITHWVCDGWNNCWLRSHCVIHDNSDWNHCLLCF
jgi:hypothetical protein